MLVDLVVGESESGGQLLASTRGRTPMSSSELAGEPQSRGVAAAGGDLVSADR